MSITLPTPLSDQVFESDRPIPIEDEPRMWTPPEDGSDTASPPPPARLVSLDAYRGFVVLLMVSSGLALHSVSRNFPDNPTWRFLGFHTDHVEWVGWSLWDLIQPSFMFMVGVALPFSIASRKARGHSFRRMFFHATLRAVLLTLLGVFLSSNWSNRTNWTFVNVLSQIGLGYIFLFLLAWVRPRWQLATAGAILLLYWAAFVIYPKPPADFDYAAFGVSKNYQPLEGALASHFNKNANIASAFDAWFLNLFPQQPGRGAFHHNDGGYATLNFIPSLATMIFGLLTGHLLRSRLGHGARLGILVGAGLAGLALGWALGYLGISPVIKRIWTPSWAIYSTGWALVLLAAFYLVIEIARLRAWAFPLVVVGMNSIAIYCMWQLLKPWLRSSVRIHFGSEAFSFWGSLDKLYAPIVENVFFVLALWLICFWMYRRKVFLKI